MNFFIYCENLYLGLNYEDLRFTKVFSNIPGIIVGTLLVLKLEPYYFLLNFKFAHPKVEIFSQF